MNNIPKHLYSIFMACIISNASLILNQINANSTLKTEKRKDCQFRAIPNYQS